MSDMKKHIRLVENMNEDHPSDEFINDLYDEWPINPLNNRELVYKSDKGVTLFELERGWSDKKNSVHIKWMQTTPQAKGVGTDALRELIKRADEKGIVLDANPWDESPIDMVAYLKRFGFTSDNTGLMVRQPHKKSSLKMGSGKKIIKLQGFNEETRAPQKVTMVCGRCGSENVVKEAWAEWDSYSQNWELSEVFDSGFCHDCEEQTRIKLRPLNTIHETDEEKPLPPSITDLLKPNMPDLVKKEIIEKAMRAYDEYMKKKNK